MSLRPSTPASQEPVFPDGDFVITDVTPFTNTIGGDWQLQRDSNGFINALQQLDSSRTAYATIGGQARSQEIDVFSQINSVSSETAAWVGVLLGMSTNPLTTRRSCASRTASRSARP